MKIHMKHRNPFLLGLALALACGAYGLAGDAGKSFVASSEYPSAQKSPLMEKLGIYGKLQPGENIDWWMVSPDFKRWEMTKEPLVVFVYGPDGKLKSRPGNSPTILQWLDTIKPNFKKLIYADGMEYPTHQLTYLDMTLFQANAMTPLPAGQRRRNVTAERWAELTPWEKAEEAALLEKEKAELGAEAAEQKAKDRVRRRVDVEEARFTSLAGLPLKPEQKELLKEAEARWERIQEMAAVDLETPPEQRKGWVMVLQAGKVESSGFGIFGKASFTGELILLKDGQPMVAARHRVMDVMFGSGTAGGLMARQGTAMAGILNGAPQTSTK